MRPRVLALPLLLLVLAAGAAGAEDQSLTATTWDQAQALAQQHGKPILIDFFTEW